ncbi:helix-turn-helix domain-containing protein, partial [Aquitalea magnusonii]|uniref:helix-turn-helix domain-containing protein n=1 Tax=Aquitalea magnusonii TaxID=332411 RepID=UPI001EFB51D6
MNLIHVCRKAHAMLELRHLRTLLALQETGSVSLAAERYPRNNIGHNPVGQIAMATFLWVAVFMCFSGFALYGEG